MLESQQVVSPFAHFFIQFFPLFLLILAVVIPVLINYRLAREKQFNILLILVLTVLFSWIVTLILVFLPGRLASR